MYKTRQGYIGVNKSDLEHILVAKANPEICGEWFKGCIVHHLNGDKTDNRPENLRVMTYTEHNALHKPHQGHRHTEEAKKKMSDYRKGRKLSEETRRKMSESQTNNPKKSKWVIKLNDKNEILHFYPSTAQAERETGVSSKNISACCLGKRRVAGGYVWKYAV